MSGGSDSCFFDWCSNNIKAYPYIGFMTCGPLMSVSCILLACRICGFLLWGVQGETVRNLSIADFAPRRRTVW